MKIIVGLHDNRTPLLFFLCVCVFASLTRPAQAIRYVPDAERKNMWDRIISVTNNALGMCCEEIEEFVMGREN